MSDSSKLNVKASGVIALAVMFSRLLGLAREVLFNMLFGTASMGIFLIAFRAPNLLRDLFAEGALSVSFVTIFSKKIETDGDEAAWKLAAKMLTLATCFMSALSLVGVFFAKYIVFGLAPGFSSQDLGITIFLTQIMYPFILLVSLAAVVMGMLNSKNVFGVPALASSFFNIGSIAGGVLCGWFIDPNFGERALVGLSIGTLVGGLLQLIVQFPSLRKVGFNFKPDFRWRDEGIRNILILTLPAIIAASAVQINVLINSGFASYVGKEAVTWLNSAFRLMQFPLGALGVAIATITLPVISRIAATSNKSQFSQTLGDAINLAVFLTLPAAVGLWMFADPIIHLIYEHGKFNSLDTQQTAYALKFYSLGLVAYAGIKIVSPAFYAIDRKWTPMTISFCSIGLNLFLNYLFIFKLSMGHGGLALSTSISATINFLTLYVLMHRINAMQVTYFISVLFRCVLASVALGSTCWIILLKFNTLLFHTSLLVSGSSTLLSILIAGMIYLFSCMLLKVGVAKNLFANLQEKLIPILRRRKDQMEC
jgi:putative peptidoglycan lipid II flippase